MGELQFDARAFYEVHGASSPLIEDLPPLVRDAERRRVQVLARLASPGDRDSVLDVGCGDGYLLASLTAGGSKAYGIELASSRLVQARRRFEDLGRTLELRQAPAEALPFEDGWFEVVVCSEVLEHLAEPVSAVREAYRVLRHGGRYVVSVPNRETITWHRCIHCGEMTPADGHLHRFDRQSLVTLLSEVGFEIRECRGTYPRLNQSRLSGSVLRLLPESMWFYLDSMAGRRLGKGNWLVALGIRG